MPQSESYKEQAQSGSRFLSVSDCGDSLRADRLPFLFVLFFASLPADVLDTSMIQAYQTPGRKSRGK